MQYIRISQNKNKKIAFKLTFFSLCRLSFNLSVFFMLNKRIKSTKILWKSFRSVLVILETIEREVWNKKDYYSYHKHSSMTNN